MPDGLKHVKIPAGLKPITVPAELKPAQISAGSKPIKIPAGLKPIKIPLRLKPVKLPDGLKPIKLPPALKPVKLPAASKEVESVIIALILVSRKVRTTVGDSGVCSCDVYGALINSLRLWIKIRWEKAMSFFKVQSRRWPSGRGKGQTCGD